MKNKLTEAAVRILGHQGKMISGSKSGYRRARPENLAVFNSNVCVVRRFILKKRGEKIWYGDIDITESREQLKELAREIGKEICVLYESDARFEKEKNPVIEKFVYWVAPDGEEKLGESFKDHVDLETMRIKQSS
jgi:hypothetical protein